MSNRNQAVFKPEAIAVVATDVDLTLYPADKAYLNACVEAVKSLELGVRGFFNKQALKAVAEKHGLHKGREVPEKLSDLAEEARRKISPDFIKENPALVAAFRELVAPDQPAPVSVFPMSHSESYWVFRVLAQVGLTQDVAPRDHCLTPDRCFGLSKRQPGSYQKLLKHAPHLKPHQFALIDDSLSNLQAAHAAGLQTIWIAAAGTSALEKPDYVGLAVNDPIPALKQISAARKQHAEAKVLCA